MNLNVTRIVIHESDDRHEILMKTKHVENVSVSDLLSQVLHSQRAAKTKSLSPEF